MSGGTGAGLFPSLVKNNTPPPPPPSLPKITLPPPGVYAKINPPPHTTAVGPTRLNPSQSQIVGRAKRGGGRRPEFASVAEQHGYIPKAVLPSHISIKDRVRGGWSSHGAFSANVFGLVGSFGIHFHPLIRHLRLAGGRQGTRHRKSGQGAGALRPHRSREPAERRTSLGGHQIGR